MDDFVGNNIELMTGYLEDKNKGKPFKSDSPIFIKKKKNKDEKFDDVKEIFGL